MVGAVSSRTPNCAQYATEYLSSEVREEAPAEDETRQAEVERNAAQRDSELDFDSESSNLDEPPCKKSKCLSKSSTKRQKIENMDHQKRMKSKFMKV